ncbi:DMT family transporter [Pseudoroseomonas globiformis]|uniref:DMT family transporter n=1 Tax=Teichococcus globiformis TaxID=2307229 RepID=A0ABV7G1D9_9PROT
MTARLWGLMLLLSLAWGCSFLFMHLSLEAWPPLTVVLSRVVLASLLLWLLVAAERRRLPLTRPVLVACLGMGLLNNVIPFTLLMWGQTMIPSGLASVVNAVTPVFTAVVAHLATADEKLTGPRLAGVLTGLLGVGVLAGPAAFSGGVEFHGILLGLGACASYALAAVWGRRFRRLSVAPVAAAAGQTSASTLMVLPLVLVFDATSMLPWPAPQALVAILGLGLVSTGIAYALFFRILDAGGATASALVTQIAPVSAILLGAAILGEALLPRHFLGMALIASGFALLDERVLRSLRRP